jgi:plasmid stabilization system protein ParE
MSLSVTFRRAARAEFIETAAWYESQRPDLGVDFIAEIERCLDAASERPTIYPAINKDVRRVVANRFPFSVYFRAEERRIGYSNLIPVNPAPVNAPRLTAVLISKE